MKKNITRQQIVKKDKQYLWHPYTQMMEYVEDLDPIVVEKAQGVYLFDKNGLKYIDGNSSWWVNNLGHGHPRLVDTLKRQADTLMHCALAGITHENAAMLGEKLCAIAPVSTDPNDKLSKVFYSDDGSTAVEVAVKMCFQYFLQNGFQKKKKFVTLKNAFHGETIGAVSVSGIDLYHKLFSPLLFETIHVSSPYCYRCPVGKNKESCDTDCFLLMENALAAKADEIAAVIVEPLVQGAAGMIIYPKNYLIKLKKLTKDLGIFLIADEVFTGFGRTGKFFSVNHAGICPDFLCLSKGITGGSLPFAATITTQTVYDGFYGDYLSQKTFYYGHSYCGNPLGAALALEVIDIFEEEEILDNIQPIIKLFHRLLKKFWDIPQVGDVRCLGMIGAIEIVSDRKTKKPFPPEKRFGKVFYEQALLKGAYLRPLGDVIYFVPPLIIKEAELEGLIQNAYEAMKEALKKLSER